MKNPMNNPIVPAVNNPRPVIKVSEKTKAQGYNLWEVPAEVLLAPYWANIEIARSVFAPKGEADTKFWAEVNKARKAWVKFKTQLMADADKAFVVNLNNLMSTRLNRSVTSDACCIDYETRRPTMELMVVNHCFNDIRPWWKVVGNTKKEAKAEIQRVQLALIRRLGDRGMIVITKNGDNIVWLPYSFIAEIIAFSCTAVSLP